MLRRQALAILGDTYRWMQQHRSGRAPLPRIVRCELEMLIALGPWMSTNLETPWLHQVYATDASMEGYGVVITKAKVSEIRFEARLAETKGWTVCLDDEYSSVGESTWSEPAAGYSVDTFEESLSSSAPTVERVRVFRVAHLFSGHRRHGDLEWWLRELAGERGLMIEVWSIDVSVDPTLDLTRDIVELLSIAFRAGFFHAAVAGPPCSTWSRARFRGGKGPRPLRTRSEPWDAPTSSSRTTRRRSWSWVRSSSSHASSSSTSWRRRAASSSWSTPGTRGHRRTPLSGTSSSRRS